MVTASISGGDKLFTFTIPTGEKVTAIALVGDLDAMTGVDISYNLEPIGNMPGNIYGNNISVVRGDEKIPLVAPSKTVSVAKRMISGQAWFDSNRNGQRDANEKLLVGCWRQTN
ncbi:hypothetical protein MGH68_01955 [Erysipelothrix sp. D19-032]